MGQIVSDIESVLNNKKQNKEIKSERKKVLQQIADDEAAKANLVKKVLAKQRAEYGAGGMAGKGMTEEAVLKRLREETEEPFAEKKKTNQYKLSKLKPKKTNLLKSLVSRFENLIG